MNQAEKKKLAEKIASRVIDEMQSGEQANLSQISLAIKELQSKLTNIEQQLAAPKTQVQIIHPKQFQHPSLERFSIEEAVSDEVNQFFQKEKACTFEPNGKPCDHCAMCSSRGF